MTQRKSMRPLVEAKQEHNRWSRLTEGESIVDTLIAASKKIEAATRRGKVSSCILVKPNPAVEKVLQDAHIPYQLITKDL